MDYRDKLLALSTKYQGDYDKMLSAIEKKENIEEEFYVKHSSNYLTLLDELYSSKLKRTYKPPIVFYYYGDISLLEEKFILGVIGTRCPTSYQMEMTETLVKETIKKSNKKVVVLSGMAKGIDQIAMKSAMETDGKVISIIASGIDAPYPLNNQGIYDYCKSGKGLVISEHPLNYTARKEDFLFRNRLIASLSKSIFVPGGKNKSGTSSTVRMSLEYGKEILSLPCNVTGDDLTNSLIQDGAKCVLSSNDILESLSAWY